jgi:UDP-glucose 4-epimerase
MGATVIVIDDLSTGLEGRIHPKAVFYRFNLLDEIALSLVFQRHRIDYVVHQAAKINLNIELEDQFIDVQNSIVATLNLLKCSVAHQIKKFVYASSVAVYGRPKEIPVSEESALMPIYSYGIAKKCAEEYVRYFSENHSLGHAILRYSNVYGPRQPIYGEVGVIAIFTDRVVNSKPMTIFGDGSQTRDYVYVADVVDATVASMTHGQSDTFNIGSGLGATVNQVLETMARLAPKPVEILHQPQRVGEIGKFACRVNKMEELLGIKSRFNLASGMQETLSYYLAVDS